jgi:FkbM family methyltransferase
MTMELFSFIGLKIAKILPRGYWRVIRYLARYDRSLHDYEIELRLCKGRRIRADLRESVYIPLFRYGCFPHQLGEDWICKRILKQGDLVFDVGANIGYPTVLFSDLVGDSGKVIALEPSRRAFRLLTRSVAEYGNLVCLNLAATSSNGQVQFNETEALDVSSLDAPNAICSYEVVSTTLDRLIDIYGSPDFIKIDVEGHEPKVFSGMRKILSGNLAPIILFEALYPSIVLECEHEIQALSNQAYIIYRVRADGTLGAVRDQFGTNNYLAVPARAKDGLDWLPVCN